jgi:hypothetical protein
MGHHPRIKTLLEKGIAEIIVAAVEAHPLTGQSMVTEAILSHSTPGATAPDDKRHAQPPSG